MKRYAIWLTALMLLAALGTGICWHLTDYERDGGEKVVLMNDIAETLKAHPADLHTLDGRDFGAPFLIYDAEGRLIYASADADSAQHGNLTAALQNGALCMPAATQSRFIGTVVLQDAGDENYRRRHSQLFAAAAICFGLLMLTAVCIGVYVQQSIVMPFRRMKQFAGAIAAGRLDEPLIREKGNLFGIFTESFDLMREELKASHSREVELKRREKELVASLSHDLKTPLTGIKLICEVLSVKTQDRYVLEKISSIGQKAEQMHVLVNDLLTTTLDDLGEMQVHCRYEPSDILQTLIAKQDDRSLTVQADLIPGCMIYTDPQRLEQVIGNILSNSYKYAGTQITVRYRLAGDYLEASFTDAGQGVPEEELCLLTQKFYRGSRAAEKEGSGLGLYIAEQLMEQMHGGLICSGSTDGLTVTLRIALN